MKNQIFYQTGIRSVTTLFAALLFLMADFAMAQLPTVLGTETVNGTYVTYNTTLRGGARFVRLQATSSAPSGTRNWEFCTGTDVSPNYFDNWRPYGGGTPQPFLAVNRRLTPLLIFPTPTDSATANRNTNTGGQSGRMRAITANNYYTFNIQNSSGDNDFSVLETTYNPKNIVAASAPPLDAPISAPVTVTATLSATLSAGEFLLIRYSTDGFATSNFVNMTLSSGTTYTGDIPGQVSGTTVQYYFLTSVTNTVGAGENQLNHNTADYLTLNLRNSNGENVFGTNFSYTVGNLVVSAGSGNWSAGSTWVGGNAPTATQRARILNGHTVTLTAPATCSGLIIDAGGTFSAGSNALTISRNGDDGCGLGVTTLNNQGTFNAGTGTVIFNNNGSVSPVHRVEGTVVFNNVQVTNTVAGQTTGLNFGSNSTVNGTFTIFIRGYVCTNAPFYAAGSTLLISTGGTYGAGTEWYANVASGQGVPSNVLLGSGTNYSFGTSTAYRQCNGNIDIPSGNTLTLSTSFGGDLKVGGNYTRNGTLTPNGRAIFFVGGATQTIFSDLAGSGTRPYMVIDKTGGQVNLNTDITVEAAAGGPSLSFASAASRLNLASGGSRTITIGSSVSMVTGSYFMAGVTNTSAFGTIIFQNGAGAPVTTGDMGTLRFDPANNYLFAFTLDKPGAGAFTTIGTSMRTATFTRTAGSFNVASGATFIINSNFTMGTAVYNNTINGTLQFNGSASFNAGSASTTTVSGDGASLIATGGLTIENNNNINVTSGSTTAATLNTGSTANLNGGVITLTPSGSKPAVNMISNGVSGTGGTVTLNDNNWTINGSNGWTGPFNVGTSTVTYTGNGVNVRGNMSYYNLVFGGSGTKNLFPTATGGTSQVTNVTNNLNFTAAVTFNIGYHTLNITSSATMSASANGVIQVGSSNVAAAPVSSGRGILFRDGNWNATIGLTIPNNDNANASVIEITRNITTAFTFNFNNRGTLILDSNWTANHTVSGTVSTGSSIFTLYLRGNNPQTIRDVNTGSGNTANDWGRLRLKGGDKTLPTNTNLVIADSLNLMSNVNLVFPANTSGQFSTLRIAERAGGAGTIVCHESGELWTAGTAATVTGPLVFDNGKLNAIRMARGNPGARLDIGSNVRVNFFTFSNNTGRIRMLDGFNFSVEGNNGGPAATVNPANTNNIRFVELGQGSSFSFNSSVLVPTGTQLLFPVGLSPAASPAFAVTGAKPVVLIPAADINPGTQTATISFLNHSGGGVPNATNVPSNAATTRTNFITKINCTAGYPDCGVRLEAQISADYNNSTTAANLHLYRYQGGVIWEKNAQSSNGAGFGSNTQIVRNLVSGMDNPNNNYVLGVTGGFLPNDPTFFWTGAINNDWTNSGNWTASGTNAPFPNSAAHFVNITGGANNPTIPANTTINVFSIDQNTKTVTVGNNSTLSVAGNYNLNFPISAAVNLSGTFASTHITGTGTGTNFIVEGVQPGTYLYDQTTLSLVGVVRSVASATSLTLARVGYTSASDNPNVAAGTQLIAITPAAVTQAGVISTTAGVRDITISGGTFTAAMRGRVILNSANEFIGIIGGIINPTTARLVEDAASTDVNIAWKLRGAVSPQGTGSLVCNTGSNVVYAAATNQMVAPATYYNLSLIDNRPVGPNGIDIYRYLATTNQNITVNGTFFGRHFVKMTPLMGTTVTFSNTSALNIVNPNHTTGSSGGSAIFRSYDAFSTHPNFTFGTSSAATISLSYFNQRGQNLNLQGIVFQPFVLGRGQDLTLNCALANGQFIIANGETFTVKGTTSLSGIGSIFVFGSAPTPGVNATFRGPINGADRIHTGGGNLPSITLEGTGAVTGDLFTNLYSLSGTVPTITNLVINRPGYVGNLATGNTQHIVCANDLIVSAGSLVRSAGSSNISAVNELKVNGTGNITHNGGGAVGSGNSVVLAGGSIIHTGTGSFGTLPPLSGNVTISGGLLDLSANTSTIGHGSTNNWTMSGGTVLLPNSALSPLRIVGNYTQTGGTVSKAAGDIVMGESGLGGDFIYNGGTLNTSGANLRFTGNSNQAFTSSTNKIATFNNLVVNKGGGALNITGGSLRILNLLDMLSGTAINATTGNITFVSNATGTARVSALPAGANLLGSNYTVERYVNTSEPSPTAGWYFFGTPITGTTFAQLQDNFSVRIPVACAGLPLSPASPSLVNVFTHLESGLPTPPNPAQPQEINGWRFPVTCNLNAGIGHRIFLNNTFFAGNRTLNVTGQLLKNDNTPHSYTVTFTPGAYGGGGWNFLANPYPSNINWNSPGWTRTNVDNAYYIWNGSTAQYGSYAGGIGTPAAWMTGTIASGQAFFVKANAGSPALSSAESVKTGTAQPFVRIASINNLIRLRVHGAGASDEAVIYFNSEASDNFDSEFDAYKIENPALNISSFAADGRNLSINSMGDLKISKEVPLNVSANTPGMYSLDVFEITNFNPAYNIYLKDAYTGTITLVPNEAFSYSFFVNADINSQGAERFSILFADESVVTGNVLTVNSALNVVMYPNPNNGRELNFTLSGKMGETAKVSITDMLGREVYRGEETLVNKAFRLNTQLPAGVYTVVVKSGTSSVAKKLVVK
jgi:hypothetical protein